MNCLWTTSAKLSKAVRQVVRTRGGIRGLRRVMLCGGRGRGTDVRQRFWIYVFHAYQANDSAQWKPKVQGDKRVMTKQPHRMCTVA